MIKRLVLISLVVLMAGCANTKTVPLSQEAAPMMEGRAISGSFAQEKPGFAAMTAGKAMFGAIGAVAMIDAGNKLVAENNVEDPAERIYAGLAPVLAEQYSLQLLDDNSVRTADAEVDALTGSISDSRLLLDVRTINWNIVYFPTVWNKYKVGYSAKMRLIDSATSEVLAESFCNRVSSEDSDTAPTYDELIANKAERLKQELSSAADYCVNDFKTKAFML